ncbi:glycine betaine ABC transporter substrate-binding protein [Oleidesulfovibrio alaskensis]|uniref:glycine betaine ABC transporter substrate-binding protein n=1 Tax=Oleidesulfovibrio alaskensis TaxID=58180 RepID=UPI000415732C|nr:glycine betaine ABC transporter substrate-binding protein [Oleidesulfovibrio alaskensis]
MKKILFALMLSLVVATPAWAASKGKVNLAYVEWDCATASTNLAKAALEDMGYEVEITPVGAAAMWMAVSTGDMDGMVTAWLPVTHGDYLKKVGNKVEDLGTIVGGARLGWAVPEYVTVQSIAELNANADKFDGKIIGIDPGAGLMKLSEEVMDAYGLDKMELVEGSGATMTAALSDAIRRDKWVVVTAWSPHWMFGKWKLRYLEDPKGVLGEAEHINTVVRAGLKSDKPEVYAFLDSFRYDTPEQLQELMAWNQEGGTPLENARRFMKKYPELVASWKQ